MSAFVRFTRSYSKDITKSVFISQSKDIYTNLALEDWLYRNFDFTNHHVLMLWQNEPCVVIGRHQNPWLEANIARLDRVADQGVKLARRNSGGGTVYHDLGNLNLTFFTARNYYNRKYNLEVIKRALYRKFGVKLDISPREDLNLQGYKVSGTAAKLGRSTGYHHCTFLVNANMVSLKQSLQKVDLGIETNATKSVSSKIINLCEDNPQVDVPSLYKAVGWEYLRTCPLDVTDGGMELANKQNGFKMVQPSEQWFPGIDGIRDDLLSWKWRFGKTPKFTITRSLMKTESLHNFKIKVVVENGKISDVKFMLPLGIVSTGSERFLGQKFSEEILTSLECALKAFVSDDDRRLANCATQVV